jgi:hypothetical protein
LLGNRLIHDGVWARFELLTENRNPTRSHAHSEHHLLLIQPVSTETTKEAERRANDRRKSGRGGRRRGDRGRPWWQKGLVLAALCAISRCWRWVLPQRSRS